MSFDFSRNKGKRKLAIFPLLTLITSFLFLPFVSQAKLINLGGASDAIYVGGNVGIGTTAPGQKLQVNGIIYANNSANAIQVNNAASSRAVYTDNFNFYSPNSHNSYTWLRNSANTWTFQGGVGGDDWTQAVQIYLQPVGTAGANDKLIEFGQRQSNVASGDYKGTRIVNYTSNAIVDGFLQAGIGYFSGNVGLGLSNPAAKLQINSGATPGIINSGSTQLSLLGGSGNVVVMTDNTGALYAGGAMTNYWSPNGTHIYNNNSGNVGIGTANPSSKLSVSAGQVLIERGAADNGYFSSSKFNSQGVALATNPGLPGLILQGGSTDIPEISWYRGGRTYPEFSIRKHALLDTGATFWVGNGQVAPSAAMSIITGGNVGIGLTNPGAKLDITGSFRNSLSTTHSSLGGSGNVVVMADNTGTLYSGGALNNYWSANGSHIYNNNSGNVGIGTTAPGTKLSIVGSDDAASVGVLQLITSGGTDLRLGGNTTYSWIQSHSSKPLYINQLGNNIILNSGGGRVGIGTTNPGAKLDVKIANAGNEYFLYSNSFNNRGLRTGNGSYAGLFGFQNGGDIGVGDSYATIISMNSYYNGTNWYTLNGWIRPTSINVGQAGNISFFTETSHQSGTAGNYVPTERMRITNTGNVGIGLTNPAYKLDVAGGLIRQSGYIVSDAATDNLLVNGDFEMNNYNGWTSGGTLAIVTGGISGNYALQVTGNGSNTLTDDYIPVDPVRDVFQLEAWVKKTVAGTTPGVLYFGYIAYDANKTAITTAPCGTYCYFAASGLVIPADGNWHKVSATTVGEGTVSPNFPVGTKYVRVLGLINYGASADAVTLLDHVTVKRLPKGPLIAGNNFSSTNMNDRHEYSTIYTTASSHLILGSPSNVGIGLTNPIAKLDVTGATNITGNLTLSGSQTFAIVHGAVWDHMRMYQDGAAAYLDAGGSENGLVFRVDSSAGSYPAASYPEVMRLLPSGNVGVGTTNPGAKLEVSNGTVSLQVNPGKYYSGSAMTNDNNWVNLDVPGTKNLSFSDNISFMAGNVGVGTTNPSVKLHVVDATGMINTGSTQFSALGGSGNRPVMVDNAGTLYTGSGVIYNRTTISNIDYTALTSDYIIAYTSLTANRTLTLPSPCSAGQTHVIVNETNSAYSVIVDPASTATISGMSNFALKAYWSIPVYCNGTNWFIY